MGMYRYRVNVVFNNGLLIYPPELQITLNDLVGVEYHLDEGYVILATKVPLTETDSIKKLTEEE